MNEIREDIKAYLDQELPEEQVRAVEEALAADPALGRELHDFRLISRSLEASAKPIPVAGWQPLPSRPRFAWWVWAAPACVFALAVVILGPRVGGFTASDQAVPTAAVGSSPAVESAAAPEMGGQSARAAVEGFSAPLGRDSRSRDKSSLAAEAMNKRPSPGSGSAPFAPEHIFREIIKSGNIEVRVKEVADAATAITTMADGMSGFVESSNATGGQNPSASITLRVPAPRFEEAMKSIRALGVVLNESSSGSDVTAAVVDLEARIRTLRSEEETLRQILRQTRRIGEVLEVRDRLTQVRSEIESMSGQAKALKDQAAYSTITASLSQGPNPEAKDNDQPWAEDALNSALSSLSGFGRMLGTIGIYFLVFSPLWLPVLLIALWLNKRNKS